MKSLECNDSNFKSDPLFNYPLPGVQLVRAQRRKQRAKAARGSRTFLIFSRAVFCGAP